MQDVRYTLPTDTLEQKKRKYMASIYPFAFSLFDLNPTHIGADGTEYKVVKRSINSETGSASAEIMTGEHAGKLTSVNLNDLVPYTGPDRNSYEVAKVESDNWPSYVAIPESER